MDKAILQGCKKGNQVYQRQLVEFLSPMLMTTCRRYCSDISACNDILQETLIKVFKNLKKFKGDATSFPAWTHRICVNQCIDHLRRVKRIRYSFIDDIIEDDIRAIFYDDYDIEYLLVMIDALPLQYRAVFNLVAIDGFSHTEVADKLEISENTSRSNYSRARKKLRQMLEVQTIVKNE